MNDHLRRAYRDLARDAQDYVNLEAVMRKAERRRAAPRWIGAAVATAAVMVVAACLVRSGQGDPVASPSSDPSGSATASSAVAIKPPAQATDLPGSGSVGTAELAYGGCGRGCPTYLLLTDGRQFRIPNADADNPTSGLTLSPDGKWFGSRVGGDYVVRDLTGTARHVLPGPLDPWAWSADSRWLLLADHNDGTVKRYTLLDVLNGRTVGHAPTDAQEWGVRGVLPSGELLLARGEGPARTSKLTVRTVDAATGAERSRRTIDLSAGMEADESVGIAQLSLGGALLVTAFGVNESGEYALPKALVVVDFASGKVLSRRVPPPVTVRMPRGSTPWISLGLVDGAALVRRFGGELAEIRVDTGEVRPRFALPEDAQVVARGRGRL